MAVDVYTEAMVRRMVSEGEAAGSAAAEMQLRKLHGAGPQWQVIDEADPEAHIGDPGWQMFDVCGFAWTHLNEKGNSRKMRLLKKVWGDSLYKSYYGGWDISAFTRHQEMSVNKAYAQARADVYKRYGYNAYATSRID